MQLSGKHHVLPQAALLYARGFHNGVVPAGSSLQYIESLPEGIDRFVLFINVEGGHFPLEPVYPQGLVDPVTCFISPTQQPKTDVASINALLRDLGISKQDLTSLIEDYK